MSEPKKTSAPLRLSPDDARLIIKAIEEVEKEEAADQDHKRQDDPNAEVA